jgi:hypothetical protein
LFKGRSISLDMTSREGSSTNKAPLFDGTNFAFWKVRMRTYLMSLGVDVWDVVETGYVKPVVLASKDDKMEFSFNAKVMNAILNGLSEEEFVKVMHYESAKEMWDKLISSYEGNEKVRDAKLETHRLKFEQLRMSEEETVSKYFLRVEELVNTMKGLGEKINDTFLVQKILRSLPDRFNSKVSAVEELDDLKMDDEEAMVDMEGELISALEEIDRLRCKKRKQKRLLMQVKMNNKKPNEDFALLKVELEEAKKIEDILKQQLSEKKARCEALEEEIVKTRKEMKNFKRLYHQNMPSIKASEGLTSIPN